MNGAHFFLKVAAKLGVEKAFGIVGGEAQAIQFDEEPAIDFYLTRHEFAAGVMADVYGRLSNQPQICYSTFGPGLTNLATGVFSAVQDRSPMLAVSAQIHRPEICFNQTHQCLDNVSFMKPITKYANQIESIEAMPDVVHDALSISIAGIPGPSYLSFPLDVMQETIDEKAAASKLNALGPLKKPAPKKPDEAKLESVVNKIKLAKQPIVIVGNQVIRESCCDILQRFIEQFNLPVVSTLASKGVIPESHYLFISPGNKYIDKVYRDKLVSRIFETCDLLLLIGYDYGEDLKPSLWEKNIPTVVVNSFCNDMGSVFQPSILIEGDMRTSLHYFISQQISKKKIAEPIQYVKNILDKRSVQSADPELIKIASVISSVRKALGPSGILCSDIGLHKQYAGLLSQTYEPNTFICSNVCGTFGFGLPAAMGAQLAAPHKRVCVICGDGGFHSTSQDLETVVRYNLPIVIVMLKDNAFGLIKYYQLLSRKEVYKKSVEFGQVDFVKLAEANGMDARHLDDPSNLTEIMNVAFTARTPLLIEIPIEYDYNILNGLMEHISLSKPVPEHAR